MGISAAAPLWYICIFAEDTSGYMRRYPVMEMKYWWGGGLFYIVGGVLYALKFPERLYPRKFDICGQSH